MYATNSAINSCMDCIIIITLWPLSEVYFLVGPAYSTLFTLHKLLKIHWSANSRYTLFCIEENDVLACSTVLQFMNLQQCRWNVGNTILRECNRTPSLFDNVAILLTSRTNKSFAIASRSPVPADCPVYELIRPYPRLLEYVTWAIDRKWRSTSTLVFFCAFRATATLLGDHEAMKYLATGANVS